MDYLKLIQQPIEQDLNDFIELFNATLTHTDQLLSQVLDHIRKRGGKRMRPMLILLMAKNYGSITQTTLHSAVGLELLHTASLVHDDVVDESEERRGQASVNASYNNKVAVLVGDYLLSTALLHVAYTSNKTIIQNLADLGRTLARGEILQLSNIQNTEISEAVYYDVIKMKTAALFESCAGIGAMSSGATPEEVEKAKVFGQNLGIIFQIRDDIFDYYESQEIGKPTGNDMAEGKLTLPVIYALNSHSQESMLELAKKVKEGTVNADEIAVLLQFAKENGGIEYAQKRMNDYRQLCIDYIESSSKEKAIKDALIAYVDYVIQRKL